METYIYPDEHHAKQTPSHIQAIYQRNIDWLAFWLRGVEDPNPQKAAMYARWRMLRRDRVQPN